MTEDKILATVTLTFANGETISRDYRSLEDVEWMTAPPKYLSDLRKSWDHPSSPLEYTATVASGSESDAKELLGA